MKTFEQEREELWKWLREKDDEYSKASRKEHPIVLDGGADFVHAQDVREYNRRLRELKKKYGKV